MSYTRVYSIVTSTRNKIYEKYVNNAREEINRDRNRGAFEIVEGSWGRVPTLADRDAYADARGRSRGTLECRKEVCTDELTFWVKFLPSQRNAAGIKSIIFAFDDLLGCRAQFPQSVTMYLFQNGFVILTSRWRHARLRIFHCLEIRRLEFHLSLVSSISQLTISLSREILLFLDTNLQNYYSIFFFFFSSSWQFYGEWMEGMIKRFQLRRIVNKYSGLEMCRL